MSEYLDEARVEALQQRLIEELDAQKRLQNELETALRSERNLRLENDILWAYLKREYPQRVKDAQRLLDQLIEGSDLSAELQLQNEQRTNGARRRPLHKRVRGVIGKVPGVHRVYHGLKRFVK